LRAWAIEGTGGHLAHREELVVELDRPERAKRRNGAKSDLSTRAVHDPLPAQPPR
jgi:hypothetical protein